MEKYNSLVYDTSKGFARFVKINFAKSFNVEVFNDINNLKDVELLNFELAFVVINDFTDIIIYNWIASRVKKVFIITEQTYLSHRSFTKNSVVINKNDFKRDIIELINRNINDELKVIE